jgi:hypothetical protein
MNQQKRLTSNQSPSQPTRRWAVSGVLLCAITGVGFMGCSADGQFGLGEYNQQIASIRSYVDSRSRHDKLPQKYVTEAEVDLADISSALASARATELESQATLTEKKASIAARRQAAQATEQIALAQVEKLRQRYLAEQTKLHAQVQNRQTSLKTQTSKNEALVAALSKERSTQRDDLISQANKQYTDSKARIAKLKKIRTSTETESLAAIKDMGEQVKATRERAQATVKALNTEAESVSTQTQARSAELTILIASVRQQSQSESKRLSVKSHAVLEDATAEANEIGARATALHEKASQEQYDLKVKSANSTWNQAQAAAVQESSNAKAAFDKAVADIDRIRGEAIQITQETEAQFTEDTGKLDAWHKDAMAEVTKIRLGSDRVAAVGRAEFVKAEAEARTNALRETAAHQQEVAEKQMNTIIAEAEAEAATVRHQILEELLARQQQDSVEFAGQTDEPAPQAEDLHEVPVAHEVAPVTAKIEPEHVAAFRTALAQVMRDRAKADSQQMALDATYAESKSKFAAGRAQQLAIANEQTAIADAIEQQVEAKLAETNAQTGATLAIAKASFTQALVEADAFRRETKAQISELHAQAKAFLDTASAIASQFNSESQSVAKQGESEATALETQLQSTKQRGQAEYNRLIAEANSVGQSQDALAAQLDAQIAAGTTTLQAELQTLDQTVQSQTIVATATYQEDLARAEVTGRKAEVEIARLQARNALAKSLAEADISRTRNLIYIQNLKGEAQIERLTAMATSDAQQALALAQADETTAHADAQIDAAQVTAHRRTAEAREQAIRAVFDSRLVQVNSERIRDLTNEYRNTSFRQIHVDTAVAEAKAAREATRNRLADLRQRQGELQNAALKDWLVLAAALLDVQLASLRQHDHAPDTTLVHDEVEQPGQQQQEEDFQLSEVATDNVE